MDGNLQMAGGSPHGPALPATAALIVSGVSKAFGGVKALDKVHLEVRRGEVHVLFGENGAGKSTLINIIAGALRPDEGTIMLDGRALELTSVSQARRHGIAAVFQEFSLAPSLTVEENIFLGVEPTIGIRIDGKRIHQGAHDILAKLGFAIKPMELTSRLSRGQQQMVEIAKALITRPKILILDEPTASLADREVERLFALVKKLQEEGVAIIYITHRIAEIERLGNRVTVLRDGAYISTREVRDLTQVKLVELMTGRAFGEMFPPIAHSPGRPILVLNELTNADGKVEKVSLEVRAGEIVGLAGLVGCGKSEIGRACFGIERVKGGSIRYLGRDITRSRPKANLDRGLCYVPSDRRREGLMLQRPVRENISLAGLDLRELSMGGILRTRAERTMALRLGHQMGVKPLRPELDVGRYSGGNQQKVMLAKYIAKDAKLFIFDEPTIGIDVATKAEIYRFLAETVAGGAGILLISSELKEIINLCHRVYVISDGRVRTELHGEAITERNLLTNFFEVDPRDATAVRE